MGKRLSKIYTRTGDDGDTGLGDGSRVPKDGARVAAMGDIDELNSWIGMVIEEISDAGALNSLTAFLRDCQHRVFDLGGEVSIPGYRIIKNRHVDAIETMLDSLNESLAPLDNFILPGGSRSIASLHLARSICRRAERSLVSLASTEDVNPAALMFLNRLSDLLFVAARYCASVTNVAEVLWRRDQPNG